MQLVYEMPNLNSELSEKLIKALDDALKPDYNLFLKLLSYIEGKNEQGSGTLVQILNYTLDNNPNNFKQTAVQMAKDAVKGLDDENYIKILQDIWTNYISTADIKTETICLDLERLVNLNQHNAPVIQYNLLRAFSKIPPESLGQVINLIETTCASSSILTSIANSSLTLFKSTKGSKMAHVALLSVYLTFEALKSIREWWKGEITGKRCAKQILDSIASVAGGVGGGYVGGMIGGYVGGVAAGYVSGMIGGMFGPVGHVVGYAIGG